MGTAKAVLKGKFIAIQAYLRKERGKGGKEGRNERKEKSQINKYNFISKELQKEQKTKPKVNRKEIRPEHK